MNLRLTQSKNAAQLINYDPVTSVFRKLSCATAQTSFGRLPKAGPQIAQNFPIWISATLIQLCVGFQETA
jgi:hypothetical protein